MLAQAPDYFGHEGNPAEQELGQRLASSGSVQTDLSTRPQSGWPSQPLCQTDLRQPESIMLVPNAILLGQKATAMGQSPTGSDQIPCVLPNRPHAQYKAHER